MHHICDNLYLGNIEDFGEISGKEGWSTITCALQIRDRTNHYIPLLDGHNEKCEELINEAVECIRKELQEGKNVLVHCIEGKHRSPTVVIWYLMKYRWMTFWEAHCHVKRKRKIIRICAYFRRILKKMAKKNVMDRDLVSQR